MVWVKLPGAMEEACSKDQPSPFLGGGWLAVRILGEAPVSSGVLRSVGEALVPPIAPECGGGGVTP